MSNRKHKSVQDFKNLRIENAVKKLGGQEQADQILAEWSVHRQSEKNSERLDKKWFFSKITFMFLF